ncbi:hypothetical protein B0H63DRAFT_527884 [Podospora didyma]|uniref:DUF6590 domain-containing protein n=1 Tax=Podospora didyma TaxID=330526 RepID=A0AAE0N467_9PEZI|nr:hypothetical protein B0H63DRAFT_527884 [Podospora didyma]
MAGLGIQDSSAHEFAQEGNTDYTFRSMPTTATGDQRHNQSHDAYSTTDESHAVSVQAPMDQSPGYDSPSQPQSYGSSDQAQGYGASPHQGHAAVVSSKAMGKLVDRSSKPSRAPKPQAPGGRAVASSTTSKPSRTKPGKVQAVGDHDPFYPRPKKTGFASGSGFQSGPASNAQGYDGGYPVDYLATSANPTTQDDGTGSGYYGTQELAEPEHPSTEHSNAVDQGSGTYGAAEPTPEDQSSANETEAQSSSYAPQDQPSAYAEDLPRVGAPTSELENEVVQPDGYETGGVYPHEGASSYGYDRGDGQRTPTPGSPTAGGMPDEYHPAGVVPDGYEAGGVPDGYQAGAMPDDYHQYPGGPSSYSSTRRRQRDELDHRYVVEHSSKFQPGEVFKIMWSEPLGATNNETRTDFEVRMVKGQQFYHGFRRFIVVGNDEGHCTCVPILTYERRACTKRGVKPLKHGIVYHTGGEPRPLSQEPVLGFPPVEMMPYEKTEKLAPESRVNYSKLVTVEHNNRVFFIGRISPEDFDVTVAPAVDKCWNEKKRHGTGTEQRRHYGQGRRRP